MKKGIISLVLLVISCVAMAQKIENKDVPKIVSDRFVKLFPDVSLSTVKWKLDKGNYKAEFSNGKEYDVFIDKAGNWVATETVIDENQLPQVIKDAVKAGEFKDWKVTEIEQVENTAYKVLYELNVVKEGQPEYEITYDSNGKLISKEEE